MIKKCKNIKDITLCGMYKLSADVILKMVQNYPNFGEIYTLSDDQSLKYARSEKHPLSQSLLEKNSMFLLSNGKKIN